MCTYEFIFPFICIATIQYACDSGDSVNIMNLGIQVYSTLSRLSRQMYLLLEELPTMVSVEDYSYQLSAVKVILVTRGGSRVQK